MRELCKQQMQVTVILEQLVQKNKTGLWFVTAAQTSGITLTQPQAASDEGDTGIGNQEITHLLDCAS
jgi:hypothetical protein